MEGSVKTGLRVFSPAFNDHDFIPERFTCDGENVNPQINVEELPENAKSLALILEDPDAPIRTWDYWVVWNIPANKVIHENSVPGIEGLNDFQQHHYCGPCPPNNRIHRYNFKIYVLDCKLDLRPSTRKSELEKAMIGHIIGYGKTTGLYRRKKSRV